MSGLGWGAFAERLRLRPDLREQREELRRRGLNSAFLFAGGFDGGAIVFFLEILHAFDGVLFRAGKEGRGLFESGSGLQASPGEIGQE